MMTVGAISQNNNFLTRTVNTNTVFASAQKPKSVIFNTGESQKINLHIDNLRYDGDTRKTAGLALLLGGIGFTTAAILESGDGQFYDGEVARGIMLGAGIGLTLTGFGLSISK